MATCGDYSDFLLLGQTGRGKRTTANKLLGLYVEGTVVTVEGRPRSSTGSIIKRWYSSPSDRKNFFAVAEVGDCRSKTKRCKVLSNEQTNVRVCDVPGFADTDTVGRVSVYEGNLEVLREVKRLHTQEGLQDLAFDRILYFLPCRGSLEKADGIVQEEIRAMDHLLSRSIFRRMIIVCTLHPRQNKRGIEFSKEDFKDTRESFTLVLENVLGEDAPICPPIIYISVSDTAAEVLDRVKSVKTTEAYHKAACTIPDILYNLSRCTYDYRGEDYHSQYWFECRTCWGGESNYGCCFPCALTCHADHVLVHHAPTVDSVFVCDCGRNLHQSNVCTWNSTRQKYVRQPFYRCHNCFTLHNEGCCYQCAKCCHRGHAIVYAGIMSAFCDCGLSGSTCRTKCQIASPKKYTCQ